MNLELINIGMMRSGIHMFLLWIIKNSKLNILWYNNIYNFNDLSDRIILSTDNRIKDINNITENITNTDMAIYSIESRNINIIPQKYINKNTIFTILIRNPYNTLASNLEYIKNNGNCQRIKKIIENNLFISLWIDIAKEFLNITTKIPADNKICVRYEKFILDKDYRKQISNILNLEQDNDVIKQSVSWFGDAEQSATWKWGSSFDKNTSSCFNNRYMVYIDHPMMIELMNDKEVLELWNKINIQ